MKQQCDCCHKILDFFETIYFINMKILCAKCYLLEPDKIIFPPSTINHESEAHIE